jgi:MerR family transcriptional regulator, thiopeptide resistance regulator
MFRIQQFAALAGVTVRTLHHYDRLGLLKPTHRSASGYRLYRNEDLGQLERIIVLRYLGLSLREIADLLATGGPDSEHSLPSTLARQVAVLRERRAGIDRVLQAIERAQQQLHTDAEPEWRLYQTILKEINMEQTQHWMEKYYSPEGREALQERIKTWTPELQSEINVKWQQLFAEIQQAIDSRLPLDSPEAKALGKRWFQLGEAFTQGNPELRDGIRKAFADRKNWRQSDMPEEAVRSLPSEAHTKWLGEVMRAQLTA